MCCQEQPPHNPKCIQKGSTRSGAYSIMSVTLASRKLLLIFVRRALTRSPGAHPSRKMTNPSTLAIHFPSAAMFSTLIFSITSPLTTMIMRLNDYHDMITWFHDFDCQYSVMKIYGPLMISLQNARGWKLFTRGSKPDGAIGQKSH